MNHTETLQSSSFSRRRLHGFHKLAAPPPIETPLDLGFPKQKLLFTIPEAADYLAVSTTTVRNLIDTGALQAGHVGISANPKRHRMRITRESMERLKQERFGR